MIAAVQTNAFFDRRPASQRVRTTSIAMTKYSNVLGKSMSSQRSPVSSNASTPTSR